MYYLTEADARINSIASRLANNPPEVKAFPIDFDDADIFKLDSRLGKKESVRMVDGAITRAYYEGLLPIG